MDTEEAREIAHHQQTGKPETDEGPYYHESWWEAYKGAVKGVFGGLVIGAAVGLTFGAAAAGLLSFVLPGGMSLGGFSMLALGFSALGGVLGAHEFSQVGVVTGAVAAAHEKAEVRIKEFETSRFAELKREIRGLKAALMGKNEAEVKAEMAACEPDVPPCEDVIKKHDEYRTQHCDSGHCGERRYVFWKVAAIGTAVGAAAGALLAGGGFLDAEILHPVNHLLEHTLGHGASLASLSTGQLIASSSIVGGTLGASFGINRDLFRQVFDVTDRLFKGIIVPSNVKGAAPEIAQEPQVAQAKEEPGRVLIEPAAEPQRSETYFRDRLSRETAHRTLLAIDHTTAIRH